MKHVVLTTAALAVATCLSVACSSFERDWARAAQPGVPRAAGSAPDVARLPLEGAWVGRWRSETTGHTGALRCLVRPPRARDLSGAPWGFRYHARWGMLSGEFKTNQPVQPARPGLFVSRGDWTVPKWAGGAYHYNIEITNTGFHGTYQGGGDHGTFSMKRPDGR